jgi:glycosyltransferase involved in cell wall biosynthesis
VAVNQCAELRRRGHDARILAGWAGAGPAPAEIEGVPAHLFRVRRVLPGPRFAGLLSGDMLRWLRAHGRSFDVAHLHLARDLIPLSAGWLLRRAGVPYAVQTHGMVTPDPRPSARLIDAVATLRTMHRATARFVLTDAERSAVGELLGDPDTTRHLPNGVESPASARPGPRPGPASDVLFLARLHPRKRVLDFAAAAERLLGEGLDATFSVVGPDEGDLAPLRAFLDERPALAGRLRYEGAMGHDEAMARMARAGVYVLPSVDEPFPMTLLEALALGVPSVCTTSCGLAPALAADGAALVVRPGVDGITDALRTLLSDDRRRREVSAAAIRTVRARFSLTAVGDQLVSTYAADHRHPEPV